MRFILIIKQVAVGASIRAKSVRGINNFWEEAQLLRSSWASPFEQKKREEGPNYCAVDGPPRGGKLLCRNGTQRGPDASGPGPRDDTVPVWQSSWAHIVVRPPLFFLFGGEAQLLRNSWASLQKKLGRLTLLALILAPTAICFNNNQNKSHY